MYTMPWCRRRSQKRVARLGPSLVALVLTHVCTFRSVMSCDVHVPALCCRCQYAQKLGEGEPSEKVKLDGCQALMLGGSS
jgi:hypothetical protein